jgi:hypothetical protein
LAFRAPKILMVAPVREENMQGKEHAWKRAPEAEWPGSHAS